MDLTGRVALVTGGGTGLGRAVSKGLAAAGATVVVNYSRSESEAQETLTVLATQGSQHLALQADLADASQARALIGSVADRLGRLDILVNNAGRTAFVPMSDLDGVDDGDWDAIMGLNVKAPWVLSCAAAPLLKESRGCIVNVGSISALRPAGSSLPYCVSKAALHHLTRCLAVAMAPEVRVNAIAPGFMPTRWGLQFGDEPLKLIADESPLGRLVSIDDAASSVLHLIQNESITGEVIVVDSGLTLR